MALALTPPWDLILARGFILEDGVCGRTGVVAVEEQALIHADDPAALPQVVVEEEQVLGHTLQERETVSTHGHPSRAWRRGPASI